MSRTKGLEIRRKQKGATIRVKNEKCLETLKKEYPNTTVIESKTSDFSKCFSVVKEELKKYYWLFIETRFRFPEDWGNFDELESLIIEEKEGVYKYTKPEFLLLCMDCIDDDWTTILGFNTDVSKFTSINDLYLSSFDNLWVNNDVRICFKNVDAAFWQVFSTQTTILHSIKQNAILLQDYFVFDATIT